MGGTEHILLESDEREVPALETARRIHARLELHGGRWRCSMELALFDYYFLSVRSTRAQSPALRYVVDLRFVDPVPRLRRRIAWRWIAAAAAFLAFALLGARSIAASAAPWWQHEWLLPTAGLFGIAACALMAAIHLTTETLTLFSAHGRAKLVTHTGRVGTFRAFRRFLPPLVAHLRIATAARRRSRAEHLRDEMREHFRLRGAGALTGAEYDAAKRRILATHAPAAVSAERHRPRVTLPGPSRPSVRA